MDWLAWDKLCVSKELGGLSFQNIHAFNLAMLGKQGWKFISRSNALSTKVFKSKYFPKRNFMGADLGNNPSYSWQSILFSKTVLKECVGWKLGNEENVNV